MRKRSPFILGMIVVLPVGLALARQVESAAEAGDRNGVPTLLEGCTDVPEAVLLADELSERALRITAYNEALEAKKGELAQAETTLRARLAELRAVEKSSLTRKTEARTAVQEDIDRLVAVYDQMKPADAAAVLTSLPPDFAAEILMRIQPENGARIIAAVEPGQAAILTTHMGARSARN